jgi:uncharacterized protein
MSGSQLKQGLPNTDYYAPNFLVEIEGKELSPQTIGDVLDLKVVMDIDNMTSFDMSVANPYDPRLGFNHFKYSDSSTFDVGRQVHIKMGYANSMVSMLTGQIVSMTPRFPENGSSILTISGLDGMFRLKDRKPAAGEMTKYVNKKDWQIAEIIATRNNLKFNATREGEQHPEVVQKNQDDAQFLMERAKRIDYDCFILTNPDTSEATLHFIKPTDGRDSSRINVYQLRWGENLINFNPTINLSGQVSQVTVRGWNPATKQAIVATAGPDDLPGATDGNNSGPRAAQSSQQGKQDVVVDAPVSSFEEARNLAISLLTERAYQFITATGQIIGLPDLRPGDNLELDGIGSRFDGEYYVKKVEHMLSNSGYKTQFEVRRMYEGRVTT